MVAPQKQRTLQEALLKLEQATNKLKSCATRLQGINEMLEDVQDITADNGDKLLEATKLLEVTNALLHVVVAEEERVLH